MTELKTRILDYLFRNKSLNTILYTLVVFLISELATFGNIGIYEFVNAIKSAHVSGTWQYYVAVLIDIIWGKGSLLAIVVTIGLIVFFGYLKRLDIITKSTISQEQINQIAEALRGTNKSEDIRAKHEIQKEKAKYKPFFVFDSFSTRHFDDWVGLRIKNNGAKARILNLTLLSINKENIKLHGEGHKEVEKGEIYDIQWIGNNQTKSQLKDKFETVILYEDEIGNEYYQTFVYDFATEIRRLSAPQETE
jgi:hypothetical protein